MLLENLLVFYNRLAEQMSDDARSCSSRRWQRGEWAIFENGWDRSIKRNGSI